MTVDREPNVRVCVTPVRDGAVVTGQNFLGSLDRDLMQMTDKLGGPFTPPGFYYKTFIRPRRLWPLYEKLLRGAAGLGKLDRNGERRERVEVEHRHADTLVVGGGEAGLETAIARAAAGEHVILVEEGFDVGGALLADRDGHARAGELRRRAVDAGVEVLAPAIAIGLFEYGFVPVAYGNTLLRIRAGKVVVASGIVEQPLVFPGNDLVGVMLPEGVRRLVNLWSIKPAERAFVLTADDRGLAAAADLEAAGVRASSTCATASRRTSRRAATRAGSRRCPSTAS
jgi:sarcosine oxidase subunit alpha